MPRKPKFRPRISRIKLNPEQAVLVCTCWTTGTRMFYASYLAIALPSPACFTSPRDIAYQSSICGVGGTLATPYSLSLQDITSS